MSDQLLKSIQHNTLAKEVANQIVELLTSGKLSPGDRLPPEMQLMEMMSVSRSALREALSSLESLGLIKRQTSKGTYFTKKIGSKPFSQMLALSRHDILSIMETRISLELGLVTLAAEKINDVQLKQLYETIEKISESNEDYAEIDREFHHIIALSAKNSILEDMVGSVLEAYDEISRHIPIREKSGTVEQHTAIYQALKSRSPKKAFDAMYDHLDCTRTKVLKEHQDS